MGYKKELEQPPKSWNNTIRQCFLTTMSLVFLWAFSSLYIQLPGLYGDNGIMPIRSVLRCESKNELDCAFSGLRPTILHLFTASKFTPLQAIEIVCLIGIGLSALSIVFTRCQDFIVYLALWFGYLSCFQVGQTFLSFQWDTLLIETGFLTALVAPCRLFRLGNKHLSWMPHDSLTMFLVRWLTFRYIFASGIVKLNAECPTWWGLTAMHYHYESQCIPTPAAWFSHQGSDWFKKLSVVATYAFEIFIPVLFFVPIRLVRYLAFLSQVFLMIVIMATGNFNFFNVLTVALCFSLLIDSSDSKISTDRLWKFCFRKKSLCINILLTLAVFMAVVFVPCVILFDLNIDYQNWTVQSSINFNKSAFFIILPKISDACIVIGIILFVIEVASSILRLFFDYASESFLTKIKALIGWITVTFISVLIFTMSMVDIARLDNKSHISTHLWDRVINLHNRFDNYQLIHSYGLFRSMTGVGGRPEVIVYGAMSENGPWKEYEFLYKVGNVSRAPPFIIPHQPRLDWQMWFAALGRYEQNDWFISLIWKLLKNEPQVLKLIEVNPFESKPPKFIKAELFLYHYTNKTDKSGNWWWREKAHDYMPPISLEHSNVKTYLVEHELLIEKPRYPKRKTVVSILRSIRKSAEITSHPVFIWSLTAMVAFFAVIKHQLLDACRHNWL